jgi:hypothetical protein
MVSNATFNNISALSFYTDMLSDMCLFFVRVWSPYLFSHLYCSFPLFRLYWFVLWKGFDTSCGDFSVFFYMLHVLIIHPFGSFN